MLAQNRDRQKGLCRGKNEPLARKDVAPESFKQAYEEAAFFASLSADELNALIQGRREVRLGF